MFNDILTIKEILSGYEKKLFSSKEVFKYYYDKVEKYEPRLNSLKTKVDTDKLKLEKNSVPIVHKDIYSTKDIETTAGSRILKGYIPPYNATSVEKLENANFVCIGKANCDAFAHGTTGENSDFRETHNPYAVNYTPGGSSSGSAACVAAGFAPVATATDTGGSIRLPASFTNTVGLKPTYGRVSRYGVIAMTSSTDSIGHITKTVWDNAYILNITAGFDGKDATSSRKPKEDYLEDIGKGIKNLVIGIPKEYIEDLESEVKEHFENNVEVFKKLGAEVKEVSLPHTEYGIYAYYIVTPSEISSNLARFDGIRFGSTRGAFGDEAKRRIMMGTYCLSSGYYDAYYLKAQKIRSLVRADFRKVFDEEGVDVLLAPVFPNVPPRLGTVVKDPLQMYLMDAIAVPVNLAGVPALAIPGGFYERTPLPIGIQLIGNYFNEKLLYKVGYAFEQETKYYKKLPEFKVFP